MIVYDDFAVRDGWPGKRWSKYSPANYDLWDRHAVVHCPGAPECTLTIRIPRYTLSHPPHHVKALMMSTASLAAPNGRRLAIRVEMAARTFGTERNPFGADPGDPRLSAAAIVLNEPESGMVLDFFVSGERLCALYERLPYAQGKLGPYPAFTKLMPTEIPTSPGQWHTYEIRYDAGVDRAEWWIDGACVARQDRIGAPPGQDGPIVKIRRLRFGGGLFTLLDDLRNDHERADDRERIPGLATTEHGELFGQGGEVTFRRFCVDGTCVKDAA